MARELDMDDIIEALNKYVRTKDTDHAQEIADLRATLETLEAENKELETQLSRFDGINAAWLELYERELTRGVAATKDPTP